MAVLTKEDRNILKRNYESYVKKVTDVRGKLTSSQEDTLLLTFNNAARVLEEGQKRVNEGIIRSGISQPSGISWFPEHMINMIAKMSASSIIEDLIWVQPIDSPQGQITFWDMTYGDSRGDNLQGNVMINDLGVSVNHTSRNRFASGRICGEPATIVGGKVELHVAHMPMLIDADNQIIFTDAGDSSKRYALRKTGTSSWELRALDAQGYPIGSDLLMAGTLEVNPDSGLVMFASENEAFSKLSSVFVDYTQDLGSAPSLAGRPVFRMRNEPIHALPHKLRVEYSFDAGYMYQNTFGIDLQKTLIDNCTMEMKQERDNEVIDNLLRQAGNHTMWDRTNTNYISQREHDESFCGELQKCANKIYQKSYKFRGNWAVVGIEGLNVLMNIGRPRFEPNYVENPNGPYVAGVLDNSLKIICSPYIRENEYLVGHKSILENSCALLADYLPIMHTDWLTRNTFTVESGFISMWAYKMLRPELLVRGEIKGY